MKRSYIKKIKTCYGKKDKFMKNLECINCQFKKRCLLEVNGRIVYDVTN